MSQNTTSTPEKKIADPVHDNMSIAYDEATGLLTISIDTKGVTRESGSQKSMVTASTSGGVDLGSVHKDLEGSKLNLTYYRKSPKAAYVKSRDRLVADLVADGIDPKAALEMANVQFAGVLARAVTVG